MNNAFSYLEVKRQRESQLLEEGRTPKLAYNERQIFFSAFLFEFHNSESRLVALSSGTLSVFINTHIIHATSAASPPHFR